MKEETCAERLPAHLQGRLQDFRHASRLTAVDENALERGEIEEDVSRALEGLGIDEDVLETPYGLSDAVSTYQNELPLSIEVFRVVKVLLSTGGPADWFEMTLDEENEITRIEYVFQDWWDGARETLEGSDYEDARDFLSGYAEIISETL